MGEHPEERWGGVDEDAHDAAKLEPCDVGDRETVGDAGLVAGFGEIGAGFMASPFQIVVHGVYQSRAGAVAFASQ